MAIRHILSAGQFLMEDGEDFLRQNTKWANIFRDREYGVSAKIQAQFFGKKIYIHFSEPSTRTSISFQDAAEELGCRTIVREHGKITSSEAKGESPEDTMRILSGYHPSAVVLRRSKRGEVERMAKYSRVPVINAGDGDGEHPTQAFLDKYTWERELGRTDDFTIGFANDLRFSRTIHSGIVMLAHAKNVRVLGAAPKEVGMPQEERNFMKTHGIPYEETEYLEDILPEVDVLYMTRLQVERFTDKTDPNYDLALYEKLLTVNDQYVLHGGNLPKLKPSAIIMHPLPRNSEIAPEVDDDPRAKYFEQAENGLWVRMALLYQVLSQS